MANTQQGFEQRAERTADEAREVQDRIEAKEKRSFESEDKDEQPPQTGAREYPVPPLPGKHLEKPGVEADLTLKPMYDAPFYKGSGKLQDKVALITGGDSGIGRAVAVLFAREGCDVAICYLEEGQDAQDTKTAVEKEGRKAILIPGDVADPAYAEAAVARTVKELGGLDILVNNAAFQEHAQSIEDISFEHFDLTLKTNLYGYFNFAKAAVPHLKPGSAIINCGSVTGIRGSKELIDYSMTKGGIHAFTRSLAGSLIKKGVRVNCVAPGPVWTPLIPATMPEEKVESFGQQVPMGRAGQPAELAPVYVLLASDEASYVSGARVAVTGGKPIL